MRRRSDLTLKLICALIVSSIVFIASSSQAVADLRCERFLVAANPMSSPRAIDQIDSLRIGTYNVENLVMHLGHYEPIPGSPGSMHQVTQPMAKPLAKIKGVAKAILDMDLDIVVLQEVENIKALEALNHTYLEDRYTPLLINGNDPRGIDIAFLVKKDLPFEIENHSFRRETWFDPRTRGSRSTRLFSRDLPVLVVRAQGQPKNSAPLFIVMGTHFKSKRTYRDTGAPDRDPDSRIARTAQVNRAVEIIGRYREEYGSDLPILFAGDFNGAVPHEPEFEPLRRRAGLLDAFDLSKTRRSRTDRVTHIYFPGENLAPERNQLDAIFVSPELHDSVLDAEAYRYKNQDGLPWPLPKYKRIRDKNPSDHWPVNVTVKFKKLLERLNAILAASGSAA